MYQQRVAQDVTGTPLPFRRE